MKIILLVRSLAYGGTERQVVVLAKGLSQRGHDVKVATFYSGGTLENDLRKAGIPIRLLHKSGRWDVLAFLFRLTIIIREERPDFLYAFAEGPNSAAVAIKLFFPNVRVVCGVRNSLTDLGRFDWFSRSCLTLSRWLSKFADAIVANSQAGLESYVASGYPLAKMVNIPNGTDSAQFSPDRRAGCRLRGQWGVKDDDKLIGIVGRMDSRKDHPTFLRAAALLAKKLKTVRFVSVGGGSQDYGKQLQELAKSLGLDERMLWAGVCDDMPAAYNAFDIAVSSSDSEGMPNAIVEAMSCGVPCVVSDVGDSAWVVGETGEVVPPKNPVALADAIERMLNRKFYDSYQIRQRIVDHFSVDSLVRRTEHVLNALLNDSMTAVTMQGLREGSSVNPECVRGRQENI